jgi:hypothetical protein
MPLDNTFPDITNPDDVFRLYINAVESSKKLQNLGMKAYNSGSFNAAIEIPNNRILKLSLFPNFPVRTESFELPILDKRIIDINVHKKFKKVYSHIQPKGLSSNEATITDEMVNSIAERIRAAGFEPFDLSARQLVIYNGQAFLADTGCVAGREFVS